ncbi:MAG TPA: DUF308 domain-containing protein [Candidatus Choladousia intestinavium]|uniref:DUF308 domain-containing protein n=1 Tax=Candidatus Choladousia intestinavium TaxID=2840727 RepID=A0A9D1AAA6_9FIRM|nr:DUF308 domain-containing protein [Candidatus Choladousia intestinavium]
MDEMKKFRRSYILLSALYVVLGIVLLVWPATSVRMICYILGFVMVVLGITYGILYFTKDRLSGVLQMDLVIGIVCLAFGAFILLNPEFLASVLPFAMGIILLLGAVVKFQSAWNMKRLGFKKWYLVMILALLMVLLAVLLLWNPFTEEKYMILYTGACLVLDGLTNLISMVCVLYRVKTLNRIRAKYPDREMDLKELLEMKEKQE